MKSQNTNQISPYGPTSRLYYVCSALVFIHFGMTLPLYSKWRPQTVYIFCLISYFICFMPTLVTFLWLPFFCVKCRWLSTLCYDNLGWFFLFLWPFMLKLFFAFSFLWTLVWPPSHETTKGCFFPLFYYLCQLWLVTSLFLWPPCCMWTLRLHCVMTPLFYDNLGWFLLFLWPMLISPFYFFC